MMRTGVHSNVSSGARHGNWPLIGVMVTDGASTRDVNRTIPGMDAHIVHFFREVTNRLFSHFEI